MIRWNEVEVEDVVVVKASVSSGSKTTFGGRSASKTRLISDSM